MSVTELRDQQNAEWHAWAGRDPGRAREHNRARRDLLATGEGWRMVRRCEFVSADGESCTRRHCARGLCKQHWWQYREGREMRPISAPEQPPPPDHVAFRNGEPWAEWEFDLAMSDIPLREVSQRLGRTYSSVVRARQRRRRMLGLGIERTKSESDPYDGSDRRGALYARDKTMSEVSHARERHGPALRF